MFVLVGTENNLKYSKIHYIMIEFIMVNTALFSHFPSDTWNNCINVAFNLNIFLCVIDFFANPFYLLYDIFRTHSL